MSDIVEWLRECKLQKCQKAADEIERLRGLLKEADEALAFMPIPTKKLADLRHRLREVLSHD